MQQNKGSSLKLYEGLASEIEVLIANGALRPGERLPSVRQQQARRGVSPATVFQAYYLLEARGAIESRPRSGYYVAQPIAQPLRSAEGGRGAVVAPLPAPAPSQPDGALAPVDVSSLVFDVLDAARLKLTTSLAAAMPSQLALAGYLAHGGYDRHLRQLRGALAAQQQCMLAAIARYFPAGTRVTTPQGGYFLWLELPDTVDALALHRAALERGISLASGPMFSARRAFSHCIRLNYGHPWDAEQESAMAQLGQLMEAKE